LIEFRAIRHQFAIKAGYILSMQSGVSTELSYQDLCTSLYMYICNVHILTIKR